MSASKIQKEDFTREPETRRGRRMQRRKPLLGGVWDVLKPYASLLTFLFGITVGYLLWGADFSSEQRRYEIEILAEDPSLGSEDAPITIVEFSDFECPFCRTYHTAVFPLLREEYGDKIRFVYKDFPLTGIHPNAVPAAEAALCAAEQQVFWEYQELLFSMQLPLGRDAYLQYAASLDIDQDGFTACLDESRYNQQVMSDARAGTLIGVRSTPTIFINGIPVIGALPYAEFAAVIEAELERIE
jgi:protein-disulfide isomerase